MVVFLTMNIQIEDETRLAMRFWLNEIFHEDQDTKRKKPLDKNKIDQKLVFKCSTNCRLNGEINLMIDGSGNDTKPRAKSSEESL